MITLGRVRVNGKVVTELGAKADPDKDKIEFDGKRLVAEVPHYIVLHKPRNVVSTVSDPEGRPTVAEYFKSLDVRLYPIGRLDFATSGVLLMTNDGEFAQALLHPRGDVPKTYVLKVDGVVSNDALEPWRTGIELDDGITKPAEAKRLRVDGDKTWLEVTLREGRNQQIRRMGEATGFPVMRLARISFAGITSDNLRPGDWRPLNRNELVALREVYGVPKRVRAAAMPIPPPRAPRVERVAKAKASRAAAAAAEPRPTRNGRPLRSAEPVQSPREPRTTRGDRGAPTELSRGPAKPTRAVRPSRDAGPSEHGRGPAKPARGGARPNREAGPGARPERSDRPETTRRAASPRDRPARGRGGR